MKNRTIFFFSILILIFFNSSCSKFVNLGDETSINTTGDGLPEEFSDDEYNKETDSGNTGNSGDMGNTGDSSDTGDSGNTGNISGDDSESYSSDDEISDNLQNDEDASSSLDGYPFSDTFSNQDCACGNEPAYDPVCCKGLISAFNACFANCYSINSSGKVCSEYSTGVCDSLPDESSDTDVAANDTDEVPDIEIPDDDTQVIDNECGCYSADTTFYCCYVNGTVFISKCMADCNCKGGYSNCF